MKLWLALALPRLAIERYPVSASTATDTASTATYSVSGPAVSPCPDLRSDDPTAVIELQGGRRLIIACNDAAAELGIHAHQTLNEAYALVPALRVLDHDPDAMARHLSQLALWAMHYTSEVSIAAPHSLLLEIAASERLFGSLEALYQRIGQRLSERALTVQAASAPTPAAALLLAQCAVARHHEDIAAVIDACNVPESWCAGVLTIRSSAVLSAVLDTLPVTALPLDHFTNKGLQQSGIRRLGELRALPMDSVARRFGQTLTDYLYRLDGRLPDPRRCEVPPKRFNQSVDLALETRDVAALDFALKRLLDALGGFLRHHNAGVQVLILSLFHHRGPATHLQLRFLDAHADSQHLLRVARERLATLNLAEPVIAVGIRAERFATVEASERDLFQRQAQNGKDIETLLDQLSARLGREAIYTAQPDDDHRPEKAWLPALLQQHSATGIWPARPLWLLDEPRKLTETVTLESSAERIENGWWGEDDVRRDYHIARHADGRHFWVFRLRHAPDTLWLHGIFA